MSTTPKTLVDGPLYQLCVALAREHLDAELAYFAAEGRNEKRDALAEAHALRDLVTGVVAIRQHHENLGAAVLKYLARYLEEAEARARTPGTATSDDVRHAATAHRAIARVRTALEAETPLNGGAS